MQRVLALPQAEALREKGYELLCLTDNVDEFALRVLEKYQEKEFKNISSEGLDLQSEEEKERAKELAQDHKDLLEQMAKALEGKVKEVKLSGALKSHAACISTEGMISTEMEKVLNSMPAREKIQAQRVLELNPDHPVFQTLCGLAESAPEKLKLYAEILYGQALLIEGVALENPAEFAQKLCSVL